MSNPARELAKLLTEWRTVPRSSSVHQLRGTQSNDVDAWRAQARAAGLLGEVDAFLTALHTSGVRVEHYLRFIPAWTSAVFIPDRPWGEMAAHGELTVVEQTTIDMLLAAADLMDSTTLAVSLDAKQSQTSLAALDEIVEALSSSEMHLRESEKRYVFELIASCRRVFQESTVLGSVDLLRRVHELLGVLTMLADTLAEDPETKAVAARIMRAARKVIPYAAFGARATVGALGAAADLIQITATIN